MSSEKKADAFEGPTDPYEPFTLKLTAPVTRGSETITELTFQPFTAGLQRKIKTPHDQLFALMPELVGLLSGQPTGVVDKLGGRDWARAQQVAQFFFAGGQGVGSEP